jgi:hypothetical protein
MRDCLWVSAWFAMVQFQAGGGALYKWSVLLGYRTPPRHPLRHAQNKHHIQSRPEKAYANASKSILLNGGGPTHYARGGGLGLQVLAKQSQTLAAFEGRFQPPVHQRVQFSSLLEFRRQTNFLALLELRLLLEPHPLY